MGISVASEQEVDFTQYVTRGRASLRIADPSLQTGECVFESPFVIRFAGNVSIFVNFFKLYNTHMCAPTVQ